MSLGSMLARRTRMAPKGGLLTLLVLSSTTLFALADTYIGCYSNYVSGARALPFLAMSGLNMSPSLCSKMAKTRFVTAYGLEYGRQCWLDPQHGTPASPTRFGPSGACNMTCTGDWSSTCGGNYAVDLYATDPTQWDITLSEASYSNVGCYRDAGGDFRIMHQQLWVSPTAMSAELCAHIAYSEHWPIFGLQYGSECWGSDDLLRVEQIGPGATCDLPCPGNTSQACGGSWAMQIYQFDQPPTTDATHAGTTSDGAVLAANTTVDTTTSGSSGNSSISLLTASSDGSTMQATQTANSNVNNVRSGASRGTVPSAVVLTCAVLPMLSQRLM